MGGGVNPSALRLQSRRAPASFHLRPGLSASAGCPPALSTLHPKNIQAPPPPLPPTHVASAFSLRPSRRKLYHALRRRPPPFGLLGLSILSPLPSSPIDFYFLNRLNLSRLPSLLSLFSANSVSLRFTSLLRCIPCSVRCISRNPPVAFPLRSSLPALNCERGHLATSSQVSSALACTRSVFSTRRSCSFRFACPASSPKVSREAKREGHDPHGTSKPRSNRTPRNPLPLRSQWRQPQGSPHPRAHQQRTRRPPIRPPQFRLQPLFRICRNPARPYHPLQRRHR